VTPNVTHEILSDGIDIFLGDCLEIMSSFNPGQFDLCWTDPPYNIGKDYDNFDDGLPEILYFQWVQQWLSKVQFVSNSVALYPPKKKLLKFWNMLPDHHLIICAWSAQGTFWGKFFHQYAPLIVPSQPVNRVKDHWWNAQVSGMGFFYREKKFDHPGQTSLDITTRIIEAFTRPGDHVLDPFGGTGTTAEACLKLGRKCTLIEQSEKYFAITKQRITDALKSDPNLGVTRSGGSRPSLSPLAP